MSDLDTLYGQRTHTLNYIRGMELMGDYFAAREMLELARNRLADIDREIEALRLQSVKRSPNANEPTPKTGSAS